MAVSEKKQLSKSKEGSVMSCHWRSLGALVLFLPFCDANIHPLVVAPRAVILPTLHFLTSHNEAQQNTKVVIPYEIENPSSSVHNLHLCVKVSEYDAERTTRTRAEIMDWSCMLVSPDAQRKAFTLFNLSPQASYLIQYRVKHEGSMLEHGNEGVDEAVIHLISLGTQLPLLQTHSIFYDAVADFHTQVSKSNFNIDFSLGASSSFPHELLQQAAALLDVCITVQRVTSTGEEAVVPFYCLRKKDASSFSISSLPVGKFSVGLVLRDSQNQQVFDSSKTTAHIEVGLPVEFVPSYEWQPLRAWHTIPSGIDTRLPLSSSSSKEARIPNPWRLQVSMPSPCKYFLRLDVKRDTTMQEVSDAASRHCGLPTQCFTIVADGVAVEKATTAEEIDFFNKRQAIKVLEDTDHCSLGRESS